MERWAPHLTLVDLSLGQVISEPGSDLAYAYFPLDGIVSLLYVMNEGESAEIALVGNDGMLDFANEEVSAPATTLVRPGPSPIGMAASACWIVPCWSGQGASAIRSSSASATGSCHRPRERVADALTVCSSELTSG